MNIKRGCCNCKNLVIDDRKFGWFLCGIDDSVVYNAGACFVKEVNGYYIIIESCADFVKEYKGE